MFVLGVNDFRKIFYTRVHVWHHLKLKSNWKYFQFDRKYSLPTRKIISVPILPSNDFQNYSLLTHSSHTRTNLISAPAHAPTSTPHTVRRQALAAQPSQAPTRFALRLHPRIAPITPIAPIVLRSHPRITPRLHQSLSFPIWCRRPPLILIYFLLSLPSSPNLIGFDEFFFGWVLFLLYLFIEKWYYIFVWKLRKCEKQVENVFSILFSRTQPNTRKYFPKHFLECNQTLENNFLSWKYFHLKIFYTRKIFYIQPNTALEA